MSNVGEPDSVSPATPSAASSQHSRSPDTQTSAGDHGEVEQCDPQQQFWRQRFAASGGRLRLDDTRNESLCSAPDPALAVDPVEYQVLARCISVQQACTRDTDVEEDRDYEHKLVGARLDVVIGKRSTPHVESGTVIFASRIGRRVTKFGEPKLKYTILLDKLNLVCCIHQYSPADLREEAALRSDGQFHGNEVQFVTLTEDQVQDGPFKPLCVLVCACACARARVRAARHCVSCAFVTQRCLW
jgi:hypothetical protein